MTARIYKFQAYDVLQSNRDGRWLDFSTLRTAGEGLQAVSLVDRGTWEGQPLQFRIRRGFDEVVYAK